MIKAFKVWAYKAILNFIPGRSPDFVIIGAQKAGTSSLHYYLTQHPQLHGSSPKEIHYFDIWLRRGKSRKWYEKHFKVLNRNKKKCFETTPCYAYHHFVPKLLYDYKPNLKIIFVLRDPVERAYSAWKMTKEWIETGLLKKSVMIGADHKILPFRTCLDLEISHIKNNILIENSIDEEPTFIRRGFYASQIERYLTYFREDQMLVLGFTDLVENPYHTFELISHFLNVPNFQFSKINLQPKNVRNDKSAIDKEDRLFLEEIFRDENARLVKLLGHKVNW